MTTHHDSRNTHRIDCVDLTYSTTQVPCGMNTIVYLGSQPPTFIKEIKLRLGLAPGKQLLVSNWNTVARDYIVTRIIKAADTDLTEIVPAQWNLVK